MVDRTGITKGVVLGCSGKGKLYSRDETLEVEGLS